MELVNGVMMWPSPPVAITFTRGFEFVTDTGEETFNQPCIA